MGQKRDDDGSFWGQFLAVVIRNFQIRKHQPVRTLAEILIPIFIAFILYSQNSSFTIIPQSNEPSIGGLITTVSQPPFEWYIIIKPNAFENEKLSENFLEILNSIFPIKIKTGFENREDFIVWYEREKNITEKLVLISLDHYRDGIFRYTISLDQNMVPTSKPVMLKLSQCPDTRINETISGHECETYRYYQYGFSAIQSLIDSAIIRFHFDEKKFFIPNLKLGTFPYPAMLISKNSQTESQIIGWTIGTFLSSVLVSVRIVGEKEKKLKLIMRMMGLKILPYFLGSLVIEIIPTIIPSIMIGIILSRLGIEGQPTFIFLYPLIQLFAISVLLLGFLLSVPFKSVKVVSVASLILCIIMPLSYIGMDALSPPIQIRMISSFFSPLALSFTLQRTIFTVNPISLWSLNDFSFLTGMLFLFLDCLIYFILILLLEALIAWKDYVYDYIFRRNLKSEIESNNDCDDIESVNDNLKSMNIIQIQSVTKIFDKTNIAVNNVTLDIYESQIFAILGQNGAGKTTLINLLTGTSTPTSGKITINGKNVHDFFQLAKLQNQFGVCFQENILCDDLNAVEHLQFFSKIKGGGSESNIEDLLNQFDLQTEKEKKSNSLSGGQKRKLCLAIALVGDSKIIFLDEPTSGVDPYSRQKIWDVLQSHKSGRVIILTTHMMHEADLLSDRKAIMTKGKIRCVGSSLYLKNRFGIGYHLRLDIDPKDKSGPEETKNLVMDNIYGAKFERATGSELLFSLPKSETNRFSHLFKLIDERIQNKNGILGYGINLTTLEDVFLKITYETGIDIDNDVRNSIIDNPCSSLIIDYGQRKQKSLQIFLEFLLIRMKLFIRNWTFLAGLILQTGIFFLIILTFSKVYQLNDSKISLNPELYPEDQKVLILKKPINKKFLNQLEPVLVDRIDLNTTYQRHYAIEFDEINEPILLINRTYKHSIPILQNYFTNNLILESLNVSSKPSLTIEIDSYPLPSQFDIGRLIIGIQFSIMFGITLITLPINLSLDMVEERNENIKNFLTVNGMKFWHYWLVNLVANSFVFIIFIFGLLFAIFVSMPELGFLLQTKPLLFLIFFIILYIPVSLNICYVLTHLFDDRELAQNLMNIGCIYTSMGMLLGILFIDRGGHFFNLFYFLWPFFNAFGCVFKIILNQQNGDAFFSWNSGIIPSYVALLLHGLWSMTLLPYVDRIKNQNGSFWIFLKERFIQTKPQKDPDSQPDTKDIDLDVKEEETRVKEFLEQPEDSRPLLMLHKIRKIYPDDKIAVNNLNLAVETGEIFGLLGPNGAGKTTTMKIITREILQTSGTVYYNGHELQERPGAKFSYCPQNDPFWKSLTLWEHLRLYATIRGIPKDRINSVCDQLINSFGIKEYKNRQFDKLSGGNQRKLCLLIAVMADCKLTLLDEPSTGMDPKSKRLMWNLIIKNFGPGGYKSAILTSHAMEEVEALCTRLAIMSKGKMECLGTIQHLNDRFGKGYILEIKTKDNFNGLEQKIEISVREMFPNMIVVEKNFNRMKITVPQDDVRSLGTFFDVMERLKQELHPNLEEYGLTQSSIENVFIEMVKLHEQQDIINEK